MDGDLGYQNFKGIIPSNEEVRLAGSDLEAAYVVTNQHIYYYETSKNVAIRYVIDRSG